MCSITKYNSNISHTRQTYGKQNNNNGELFLFSLLIESSVCECVVFVEYRIIFHNNTHTIIIAFSLSLSSLACVCAYCSFVCRKKISSKFVWKLLSLQFYTLRYASMIYVRMCMFEYKRVFAVSLKTIFHLSFFFCTFVCAHILSRVTIF